MELDRVFGESRLGGVLGYHRPRGPAQLLGNGNAHGEVSTSIAFVLAAPDSGSTIEAAHSSSTFF